MNEWMTDMHREILADTGKCQTKQFQERKAGKINDHDQEKMWGW